MTLDIKEEGEEIQLEYLDIQKKELLEKEEQKKVQIKILGKELEIIDLRIQANILKR